MRKFFFILMILICVSIAGYSIYELVGTAMEYREGRVTYERISSQYTWKAKTASIDQE